MCGLVGILSCVRGHRVESSSVELMMARLRHRGPDDAGIHLDGEFGVGVRRLSILDFSPIS